MTQPENTHIKELIYNRKATFQYEIIEKLETGIVLKGTEIKSLRQGGGNLQDAFITVEDSEIWLILGCLSYPMYKNMYKNMLLYYMYLLGDSEFEI